MAETYIIIVRHKTFGYPFFAKRYVLFGTIEDLEKEFHHIKTEYAYLADAMFQVKQVTQTFDIDISKL